MTNTQADPQAKTFVTQQSSKAITKPVSSSRFFTEVHPNLQTSAQKNAEWLIFVYNSIATQLLQRLEVVKKIHAPLESLWLQARYFILLSIPASASVSDQKSVTDSQ